MRKLLFLGLGNPILSDDAVGIRVVDKIKSIMGDSNGIDFVTGSMAGLRILDVIQGYDELVIVDAIEKGGEPGTLYKIPIEDLESTLHLTSLHSINLVTAIELGRKMSLKIPKRISIYGIEVKDVVKFSEKMTPEVEESIPKNAEEIIRREV
ncbi:MAG: hydrogenase maturation protease [Candidatus Cloacimonadota bacterium]|nr:MAG: hydrogenase maturation protease [Candidatus Cloacimonadota bacterium]